MGKIVIIEPNISEDENDLRLKGVIEILQSILEDIEDENDILSK